MEDTSRKSMGEGKGKKNSKNKKSRFSPLTSPISTDLGIPTPGENPTPKVDEQGLDPLVYMGKEYRTVTDLPPFQPDDPILAGLDLTKEGHLMSLSYRVRYQTDPDGKYTGQPMTKGLSEQEYQSTEDSENDTPFRDDQSDDSDRRHRRRGNRHHVEDDILAVVNHEASAPDYELEGQSEWGGTPVMTDISRPDFSTHGYDIGEVILDPAMARQRLYTVCIADAVAENLRKKLTQESIFQDAQSRYSHRVKFFQMLDPPLCPPGTTPALPTRDMRASSWSELFTLLETPAEVLSEQDVRWLPVWCVATEFTTISREDCKEGKGTLEN